ncbi:MAG: hypothetical protein WCB05_00895 [Candidatus Sulfotelmatobacter sp.]
MTYLRSWFQHRSPQRPSSIFTLVTINKRSQPAAAALAAFLLISLTCVAQDQSQTGGQQGPQPGQSGTASPTVTIPAGTQFALVLTHPVQSRVIHHGDDIYAQITSPVNSGNEMVIPPGTFVQGTVDKLEQRKGQSAELHLQSMAITFPDGYVTPVSGPITLQSNEGYAIKDPGSGRAIAALALPAAGAGVGALIGHSVGTAQSTTTSPFPPGCIGGPPFCTTTSTPVFGTKGKDAIIGAGVGAAIGAVGSVALLFGSHHFFLDVGSPVEMTLQHPITLQQNEVAAAVAQSAQHPVAEQPVAPRPVAPPPPDMPANHGTCYTPGSPGTPSTVIPGPPGPDGVPGPPTIIPGIPPTPGTAYPCP